jgi:hypothetical protein
LNTAKPARKSNRLTSIDTGSSSPINLSRPSGRTSNVRQIQRSSSSGGQTCQARSVHTYNYGPHGGRFWPTAEGFGQLFVKNVACHFGLPDNIVTNRDPRWTLDFWISVAAHLKMHMSLLSSSHHPQHDGQTEIVNKRMEIIMLWAYAAQDKTSWSNWLHLPIQLHAISFYRRSPLHAALWVRP